MFNSVQDILHEILELGEGRANDQADSQYGTGSDRAQEDAVAGGSLSDMSIPGKLVGDQSHLRGGRLTAEGWSRNDGWCRCCAVM